MKFGKFSQIIVEWYQEHGRDLPWRQTNEPYPIWLSEIILQQTRVNQGLPYYLKFVRRYPTVINLARASEQEVLQLWQGLGYYTRARNLHACSREIAQKFNGQFPTRFKDLIKLPGIGYYTAAAIASFAFGERVAAVDGNVYRVLSRYFGIELDIATPAAKKYFFDLANELIASQPPGLFNQAMMDFGALQCLPRTPQCQACPLKKNCYANLHGQQAFFPVKRKKIKTRKRYFSYFVLHSHKRVLLRHRNGKDIWKGLYEFPVIEEKRMQSPEKLIAKIFAGKKSAGDAVAGMNSTRYKHQLTHQTIHAQFISLKLSAKNLSIFESHFPDVRWYTVRRLGELPKPTLITRYLDSR